MQNCTVCTKKNLWTSTGKTENGRRLWKCRNCGNEQWEEAPQGLKIPAKVLYFDLETALMKVTTFSTGRQWVNWKSVEQDTFVLCWGAAWMHKPKLKVVSKCVTPEQAQMADDYDCLLPLWDMMDEADYIVGHNMRAFDWKMVNARFITHGWNAPRESKIVDTLLLSRRRYRMASHAMDAWVKKLGGEMKEDMRREDWEACLKGDEKALKKMEHYCRGDIKRGVQIARAFQNYYEQATGNLLFK